MKKIQSGVSAVAVTVTSASGTSTNSRSTTSNLSGRTTGNTSTNTNTSLSTNTNINANTTTNNTNVITAILIITIIVGSLIPHGALVQPVVTELLLLRHRQQHVNRDRGHNQLRHQQQRQQHLRVVVLVSGLGAPQESVKHLTPSKTRSGETHSQRVALACTSGTRPQPTWTNSATVPMVLILHPKSNAHSTTCGERRLKETMR
jgi:hypothetical protein